MPGRICTGSLGGGASENFGRPRPFFDVDCSEGPEMGADGGSAVDTFPLLQNLQLDRRLLLWLSGALLVGAAPGWAAPTEQRAGAVEDVLGSAFAETGAQRRILATQTPIFIGDQVATETRSRLTARLGQSTT